MAATPQERLALGVAALLLAAGAAARTLAPGPAPAELSALAGAEASASALAADVADSVERAARRRAPLAAGERLDPNTATADELDRLPRVGPALAQRIVDWRQARGPFRTLADLDSVPGMGPALLRNAAQHLTLRPAPEPTRRADASAGAAKEGAVPAGGRASPVASASSAGAVDLNTATAEELAALPGIGPALAGRIVQRRAAHGRFGSVDELAEVQGIGPATLERLRPGVRASP